MDILAVADKLAGTNVTQTLVTILNRRSIQKFITDLNTQVQLFQQGENSESVQLMAVGGTYAPSTIRIKRAKGQPSNRITLRDTGDFYNTFSVDVKANASFSIQADTEKGDQDLQSRWGDNIVGLQQENIDLVMIRLEEEFYKQVMRGL